MYKKEVHQNVYIRFRFPSEIESYDYFTQFLCDYFRIFGVGYVARLSCVVGGVH